MSSSPGLVLPEGWKATVDPTSGQTYYYHATTRQTTWKRPTTTVNPTTTTTTVATTPTIPPQAQAQQPQPPQGVPETTTTAPTTTDHNHHHTTKQSSGGWWWSSSSSPSKEAAAIQQQQPPQSLQPAVVPVTQSRLFSPSALFLGFGGGSTPTKTTNDTNNTTTNPPTTTTSTLDNPWQSAVDPSSGQTYYYHKQTRETTWTRPSSMEEEPPTSSLQQQQQQVEPRRRPLTIPPAAPTPLKSAPTPASLLWKQLVVPSAVAQQRRRREELHDYKLALTPHQEAEYYYASSSDSSSTDAVPAVIVTNGNKSPISDTTTPLTTNSTTPLKEPPTLSLTDEPNATHPPPPTTDNPDNNTNTTTNQRPATLALEPQPQQSQAVHSTNNNDNMPLQPSMTTMTTPSPQSQAPQSVDDHEDDHGSHGGSSQGSASTSSTWSGWRLGGGRAPLPRETATKNHPDATTVGTFGNGTDQVRTTPPTAPAPAPAPQHSQGRHWLWSSSSHPPAGDPLAAPSTTHHPKPNVRPLWLSQPAPPPPAPHAGIAWPFSSNEPSIPTSSNMHPRIEVVDPDENHNKRSWWFGSSSSAANNNNQSSSFWTTNLHTTQPTNDSHDAQSPQDWRSMRLSSSNTTHSTLWHRMTDWVPKTLHRRPPRQQAIPQSELVPVGGSSLSYDARFEIGDEQEDTGTGSKFHPPGAQGHSHYHAQPLWNSILPTWPPPQRLSNGQLESATDCKTQRFWMILIVVFCGVLLVANPVLLVSHRQQGKAVASPPTTPNTTTTTPTTTPKPNNPPPDEEENKDTPPSDPSTNAPPWGYQDFTGGRLFYDTSSSRIWDCAVDLEGLDLALLSLHTSTTTTENTTAATTDPKNTTDISSSSPPVTSFPLRLKFCASQGLCLLGRMPNYLPNPRTIATKSMFPAATSWIPVARSYQGRPWEVYSNHYHDSSQGRGGATREDQLYHHMECDKQQHVCSFELPLPPSNKRRRHRYLDAHPRYHKQGNVTYTTLRGLTTQQTNPGVPFYYVLAYRTLDQSSDTPRDEIMKNDYARFLEQTTFGTTRAALQEMMDEDQEFRAKLQADELYNPTLQTDLSSNTTSGSVAVMAQWLSRQMDAQQTKPTSHREFWRRHAVARFETSSPTGHVTHPCQLHAAYRRFTFVEIHDEKVLYIDTVQQGDDNNNKNSMIVLRMDHIVLTVLPNKAQAPIRTVHDPSVVFEQGR